MKKLFYVLLNVLIFMPVSVLAVDCESAFGTELYNFIQDVYTAIRIVVPILVIVFSAKDMLTAVTAGKADEMKKAQASMIKRIIIGVVIFFVPTIIEVLLYMVGINSCPVWK